MNKTELIQALSGELRMPKADAERSLNGLTDIITKALKKGDKVAISGFGIFSVTKRAARVGRNPATGKEIQIPAKKAVKFKPSTELKSTIK